MRGGTESQHVRDLANPPFPLPEHRGCLVDTIGQDKVIRCHARQRLHLPEEAGPAHAHLSGKGGDADGGLGNIVLDVLSEAIDEGTVLRADDVRLIPLPTIILNLLLRSESLTQFLPCGKNVPYQGHDHLRAERLGHIKVGPVLIPYQAILIPGTGCQDDYREYD